MSLTTHEFIRRFLMPRTAKGLPSHPPLRAACQRPTAPQTSRTPASCSRCHLTGPPDTTKAAEPDQNPAAAASMPLLRRPHDRHRDFRARLRAQAPASTTSGTNQDRHLMMKSPPIDDSTTLAIPAGSPPAASPNLRPSLRIGPRRRRKSRRGNGRTVFRTFTPICSMVCSKPTAAATSAQPLPAQPRG